MGIVKRPATTDRSGIAELLNIPVLLPKADVLRKERVDVAFVVDTLFEAGAGIGWASAEDAHRGFSLTRALKMAEVRNFGLPADNELDRLASFQAKLGQVLTAGAIPIAVHADQLGSVAAIRSFAGRFDKPGAVIFALDPVGQCDFEISVADTIVDAVEAGFNPENCVVVGLSGWCRPLSGFERMKALGVHTISLEEIWSDSMVDLHSRIATVAGRGSDAVFLSFDMRRASETSTEYGVTARDLFRLIQKLSRIPIRGVDVCLSQDNAKASPGFALPLVFETLSQVATREGKSRRRTPRDGAAPDTRRMKSP